MTLAGTDNAGGAGIDKTEYKVDGGAFATYTAPIVVSTPGTHTIEYRSTDKNGNVEATKTLSVKVDKVTPSTTAALSPASPGPGGTYTGPVGLTLTATDATSGVAKTEYQVNAPSAFGAFGAAKLVSAAARRVRHVRPGQQAVVHGSGRLLDRLPLGRRGRQRGDGQDGRPSRSPPPTPITTAPVTTGTLDPAAPGAGPHLLGAGHGEVLGQRSGPGRSGGQERQTSRPRATSGFRTPPR